MPIPSTTARVLHAQTTMADRFLPEGPRSITYLGREALAWVNIQTAADATTGMINVRTWDDGQVHQFPQPRRPGFLFPTDVPNVLFVGREKELGTFNLLTQEWTTFGVIADHHPRTIINDGEIVPGGKAIVFGTKDVQFAEGLAHLYLFTLADRRCTVLAEEQVCSNGKVFRQEGHNLRLYDIDTPRRSVVRYTVDLEQRQLRDPSIAIDLHNTEGFPDGMVDVGDGSVIIAFYHPTSIAAGHARRYDLATGAVQEEWRMPESPRVTCPLLVARDGQTQLICTTATEGMPPEMFAACPHAGDLFIAPTTIGPSPIAELVRLLEG